MEDFKLEPAEVLSPPPSPMPETSRREPVPTALYQTLGGAEQLFQTTCRPYNSDIFSSIQTSVLPTTCVCDASVSRRHGPWGARHRQPDQALALALAAGEEHAAPPAGPELHGAPAEGSAAGAAGVLRMVRRVLEHFLEHSYKTP